jgi:hypothetical protein
MAPEVQIGLIVAVATLLAGAIPAVVAYAANRETLRHERRMRLREERKAAYSRFLDGVAALNEGLREGVDSPAADAARRELRAANSVVMLTADPAVDRAAKEVMRAVRDRELLKEARLLFLTAARGDLDYGPVSTGSPRATQSLHEPG